MKPIGSSKNLLSQNKYLASKPRRIKATLISVSNSCLMEGITCTELTSRLKNKASGEESWAIIESDNSKD